MKKRLWHLAALAVPLLLFTACGKGPWEVVELELPAGETLAEAETHGGFHGDGESFLLLSFDPEGAAQLESQLDGAERWRPLPIPEDLTTLIWGGGSRGPCYTEEDGIQIPEAREGWYFFCSRSDSADFQTPGQLLELSLIHILQAAGGIENNDVVAIVSCMAHRLVSDDLRFFGAHLKDRYPGLCAHRLQLIDGRRPVDVTGDQQRTVPILGKPFCQLCRMCGLARTLQAAQQNHCGGRGLDAHPSALAAHEGAQLLVDDLDNLLGWGEALHHLGTHGLFRDRGDELFRHFIVDIRLQQRHAHFPHGCGDIRFAQLALLAQFFECLGELFAQTFKCQADSCLSLIFLNRFRRSPGPRPAQSLMRSAMERISCASFSISSDTT